MNYITAVYTDIGIKKSTNQDSALIMEASTDIGNIMLAVMCDGMGGLAKGEVASSAVIHAFETWFETELPTFVGGSDVENDIVNSWGTLIQTMNNKISNYGRGMGISLGTTVVALLFVGTKYYSVSIGDTRLYYIDDKLYQITKDQTFVQREMDMGRMTYEEAMKSPQRNVLLQCIGASEFVEPEYFFGDNVAPGQMFMICTDGFRHVISDSEIYERMNPAVAINEQAMHESAVYLTELNKYRREQDNISVMLVRVE